MNQGLILTARLLKSFAATTIPLDVVVMPLETDSIQTEEAESRRNGNQNS